MRIGSCWIVLAGGCATWAAARGLRSDLLPDGLQVGDLRVRLVHAELGSYLEAAHGVRPMC